MVAAGHPENVLIGIGATRYTAYGESTFLKPGDEGIVRVYDTAAEGFSELRQLVWGALRRLPGEFLMHRRACIGIPGDTPSVASRREGVGLHGDDRVIRRPTRTR